MVTKVLDADTSHRKSRPIGLKTRAPARLSVTQSDGRHGAGEPAGVALPAFGRFSRPALVNGAAGLVTVPAGRPMAVPGLAVGNGKIVAIGIPGDLEHLGRLGLAILNG